MTKACIRKTKTEGIHNLVFCCRLEISVANINILNIIIVLLITEMFMSRMVLKIIYNGVGKLTALLTDKVIVFLRPVICFQKESREGLRRTAVSGI